MTLPDGHPDKSGLPQDMQAFLLDYGPKALWLIVGMCTALEESK